MPQATLVPSTTSKVRTNATDTRGENSTQHLKGLGMRTPIQETDPLTKIELIGAGTRRGAGRTMRRQTLLPGRDGFTGRVSD